MISLLLPLLKNDTARAIATLVAIPVIMIGGTTMAFSINPESSTIGPFHLRNYWLLYDIRRVLLWTTPLAVVGLWFLTCLFVVRAKGRSYVWSALGLFGPFGLIALTMLGNKRVKGGALDGWIHRKHWALRALYQVVLFVVVVVVSDQLIVFKRPLVILWQSYVTGFSVEEIIQQENASSGMWAFGELLETLFLVVLFYLLWPICFNAAGRLPRLWAGSKG